jgi:hypothetical protein
MTYPLHLKLLACCVSVTALLPGCAIHPLPGDIPQVPTAAIVQRIRCEVQDGLKTFPHETEEKRRFIESIIKATTIGYEFTFKIEEDNDAPSADLEITENRISGSKLTLAANASATLHRENKRAFIALEDLSTVDGADCSAAAQQANWLYPITGATGMAEVVQSYLKLQLLTDLKNTGGTHFDDAVFSDALTYTTILSAGINPTLELKAGVGSLRLTKASITGTAKRMDQHDVTVALSFDETKAPTNAMRMAARRARNAWSEVSPVVIPAANIVLDAASGPVLKPVRNPYYDSRTLRRIAQNDAGVRTRVLIELERRRKIREDARVVARVLGTPLP